MKKDSIILKEWQKEKKNFTDNLLISRKRPTKDSVHDLRVAVKKIRSYLRLKEQLTGDKWKELFSKISVLFKSFGRLRDYDMSLNLTRQQERQEQLSFTSLKEYLTVNRSLTRRWAKKDAIQFNEEEPNVFSEQFNLLVGLTDTEIREKITQLSRAKIKKVKSLSKRFQKNAHETRKQLKDVYYWIKICPKDLAESFINMKAFDRMLKYLGSWQDHTIFRKKINQYIKDLPKKNEERIMLKTLEKNLENAQSIILEKAIKKWEEIINKKATLSVAFSAPDGST